VEPLHKLFQKAQHLGLLDKLSNGSDRFRDSLYVDDAVLFIKPTPKEVAISEFILDVFAQASGLVSNKTDFFLLDVMG
jgi:hypothetical protein